MALLGLANEAKARPMFCTNTQKSPSRRITANDVGSTVSQLVVISVQRASARAAPSVNGLARLMRFERRSCPARVFWLS
jgi:hypothetical protein